ncbi:MAG TPA: 16S rRNA (guanine(966)-N(2))-methyltransferase RsmD [bacterium]|nr:16S rRNA (guanine(966)-N(2))-methyltransferase RsmD [bacterium]
MSGGRLKGRKLFCQKDKTLRPTSQLVKKAIFDALGGRVVGKRVLDLFSGTGALGIEAASAGAQKVCFVEGNPRTLTVLKRNLKTMNLEGCCCYLSGLVERVLPKITGESFDLVLADPPYEMSSARIEEILRLMLRNKLLTREAIVVLEHSRHQRLENVPGYKVWKRKQYGETVVTFFQPFSEGGEKQ